MSAINIDQLKRAGFEEDETWWNLRCDKGITIAINFKMKRTVISNKEGVFEVHNVDVHHCEYFHELQTLHKAVTGKELNYG